MIPYQTIQIYSTFLSLNLEHSQHNMITLIVEKHISNVIAMEITENTEFQYKVLRFIKYYIVV